MVLSSAEKSRRWRENHPGEMAEHNRQYRENHPERRREQRWKLNGIQYNGRPFSFEDYEREYKRINGECEICGEKLPFIAVKGERPANVDHDHKTGEFRGLLCWKCNMSIHTFEKYKRNAMAYIFKISGAKTEIEGENSP